MHLNTEKVVLARRLLDKKSDWDTLHFVIGLIVIGAFIGAILFGIKWYLDKRDEKLGLGKFDRNYLNAVRAHNSEKQGYSHVNH
ncbi:hypothetical protein CONCODRAFT_80542 [Conidiobolus coronatus NRRL 28638]|uniref:Uncharacterized protein n=1 Tax=Conidiobolus coronatus (strain ATCC 28846 / CBS 209.66 / NRRL 28638) TaxID=796925 RepID=A0A137NU26_CONC2|nr:hypothetical protein CONCODRAFT_80542 [Conidiobolus coronatus NRRL 28638]|eukprot:KXN66260.1 hypothetical protein CONCODRAFT_80542 [Conidiobolus coronatus NRRL 28638]